MKKIELPVVETAFERWEADAAIVCSGDDFQTLYPEVIAGSGRARCKLQMMRTESQRDTWQLGPVLAAVLTLRFCKASAICTAFARLKAAEKPEYELWEIHVLVSRTDIDDLILSEARTFPMRPCWYIVERRHGVYTLHSEHPFFEAGPASGVHILTAPGGPGMTLPFGLAERTAKAMA